MEPANVEFLAECLLRLVTQLVDFQAANHVRRRLTGVDDAAFDGFHDAAGGVCRVILDIFDRLLARSAFVVQSRFPISAGKVLSCYAQTYWVQC
jgi:hypothetical protein